MAAEKAPLSPLTLRIVAAIKAIPRGRTASYGEVARMAGSPRSARQVARVLHSLSQSLRLPWHRVIGAARRDGGAGRISLPMAGGGAEQARLLKKEGLAVDAQGRVAARKKGGR